MSTSRKFGLSSSCPDTPMYTGQHAPHITVLMDRSGSFCESIENPILSSFPNMSRSSSSATQEDVVSFFNYMRFDPKLIAPEHKFNRQTDYKRHIQVALGVSPDEPTCNYLKGKQLPSLGPEDVKRLREGLHASCRRARERAKLFSEALTGFINFFPNIPSKKRSRTEGFSNDRSSLTLNDRSILRPRTSKVGVQGHAVIGGFENEPQKSEERTKIVPNKRTRTLVDDKMDVRTNSLVRPSRMVDRDKEMLRIADSVAVQAEERIFAIGGDGWGKSKMKKRRSAIKPEGSPSSLFTKTVNTFQEPKQGMQQRHATDGQSKLSNDSHLFRPGISSGTVGVGKSDSISQQTGLGISFSTPKIDLDNNSAVSDRRDRPINPEKERVNFRVVNKAGVCDDFNSGSPTSSAKLTFIRAPRSGSGVTSKLSPAVHKAAVPNDWELAHCTTKPPAGFVTNNCKRAASSRSSSPPVVHWQRPQKSSRAASARRTNFIPIGPSNDDSPALDSVSDIVGNDFGLGNPRRLTGSSPEQVKLKGDSLSSAALSESEESVMAVIIPKEKGRKPDDTNQKAGKNIQKFNLVLTARKNKLVSGEDNGDGVQRQGRSGCSFPATRSLMPANREKLGNIGTAKQLRSSRLGLEKSENKAGRPPTRKLSDRKAYSRQKHTAISAEADFLVGSENGHEELLAAVNGVITSAHAFSSQFWRQMEPFFALITEDDITYWKEKINFESSRLNPTIVPSNIYNSEAVVNEFGLIGCKRDVGSDGQRHAAIDTKQLAPAKGNHNVIPLCQRLISAFISEDCSSENEEVKFDAYKTEFKTDEDLELSSLDPDSQNNYQFSCHSAYNGYRITGKPELDETESDIVNMPSTGLNSSLVGVLHDNVLMPSLTSSELQYDTLDVNDKLLLELQSIGIAREQLPKMSQADAEGICEDISRLEEDYQVQISKKKGFLSGLLKSASVTNELAEKDFEQRSLDKLVVMAYEKYVACWGSSPSGGKQSSNKMAKQAAALAFVKRTLERCRQFEDMGKSCFNEPSFRDMFLAAASQLSIVRQLEDMEAESAKLYASSLSLEARTAAMGSQQSLSQFSQSMDNHDINSSDIPPAINNSYEQTGMKEDIWLNRGKKRELYLDDVDVSIGTSNARSGSAKKKRSERDRDGKGQSREVLSRNGTAKTGRPALSSAKGERKTKTKPKQKASQHSVSVNGLLGKLSDQPETVSSSVSKSNETSNNIDAKGKDEFGLGELDDHESIDLSNLQLPGMDVIGVPDDVLGSQGQDFDSWLNIDDDGLQDHDDFMGLEIPMDDLADLNMMV